MITHANKGRLFKALVVCCLAVTYSCHQVDIEGTEMEPDILSNEVVAHFIEKGDDLFSFQSSNVDFSKNDDITTLLKGVSTEAEAIDVFSSITEEPETYYRKLKDFYFTIREELFVNESFMNMSAIDRDEYLIRKISYLRSSDYMIRTGFDYGSDYKTDLARCHDKAMVGAAACGLLTPTLWVALLCGGFVAIDNELCHEYAYEDFQKCKKQ